MSKEQISVIIGAVISLVITVLGVFGYNVLVVQPALEAAQPPGAGAASRAVGDTNFTNVAASGDVTAGDDVTVGDDLTVGDDVTVSGDLGVNALTGPLTITGPTAVVTTTAAAVVNNLGAANNAFEVRDAATPVFVVGQAGAWTASGAGTLSGGVTGPLAITGPTAAATATPGVVVDNLGAANNAFEVRDAATPVFVVGQGGVSSVTGALTMSGGYTANGAGYVNAPTAVATATPALMVNTSGVSNILELRTASTPVVQVASSGAADFASTLQYGLGNWYPMGYATTGYEIQCGITDTFTNTATITATALSAVTYAVASQRTTPAATAALLTVGAPSGNTFALNSYEADYTVGTTGIIVHWCAIGQ